MLDDALKRMMRSSQYGNRVTEFEQFCLHCFAMFPAADRVCPSCGFDVSEFDQKGYFDWLLNALHHPLADFCMRAIVVLGLLAGEQAADALVDCVLRHPTDVPEGLVIVRGLARINNSTVRRRALLRIAEAHPARAFGARTEKLRVDRRRNKRWPGSGMP